jgi:hypothetical protein
MPTYSATIYVFSSDNNATKKETKKCENPVVTCKEWLAGQKQIRKTEVQRKTKTTTKNFYLFTKFLLKCLNEFFPAAKLWITFHF